MNATRFIGVMAFALLMGLATGLEGSQIEPVQPRWPKLSITPPPAIQRIIVANVPLSGLGPFAPGETINFAVELAGTPMRATRVNLLARANGQTVTLQGMPSSVLVGPALPFANFSATAPAVSTPTTYSVRGYYLSPSEEIPQIAIFTVDPAVAPGAVCASATPTLTLTVTPTVVHSGDNVTFRLSVPCKPATTLDVRIRRTDASLQRTIDPPAVVEDGEGSRNGLMHISGGSTQSSAQGHAGTVAGSKLITFTAQTLNSAGVGIGAVSSHVSVNVIP